MSGGRKGPSKSSSSEDNTIRNVLLIGLGVVALIFGAIKGIGMLGGSSFPEQEATLKSILGEIQALDKTTGMDELALHAPGGPLATIRAKIGDLQADPALENAEEGSRPQELLSAAQALSLMVGYIHSKPGSDQRKAFEENEKNALAILGGSTPPAGSTPAPAGS